MSRPVDFQYLGLEESEALRPYSPMWDYQRQVHARVAAEEIGAQVLYVQHEPVYTAGRRTLPAERPFDGTPVVEVDRGGKITYHGPGQLTGYPIVKLVSGIGVVDYVRRVEEALIRYLSGLGIPSGRIEDRTGVWCPAGGDRPERKICAIGLRVAKRTTLHGFGLNVTTDLTRFGNIVPCGIADAGVTSIAAEVGHAPSLREVADGLSPHLVQMMQFEPYEKSPDARDL